MENESTKGTLAGALARAQGEFQPVAKNKTARVKMKSGGEYSYRYADLADCLKMVLPVLSRHGLAFSQPLRRSDGHLVITSRLSHSSGESLQSDGIILPENLSPQEFGSALSYMRRYDACSLLGISPDEDTDAQLAQEAATTGRRVRAAQEPPAPAESSNPTPDSAPDTISDKQRRRMFALASERHVEADALKDYLFQRFNYIHSKDVLKRDYQEVCDWIEQGGTK